ncbi:MAG: Tfp pilus assembly protein FimT/FimU [Burkholderiales bacterium]
MRGFTLPELIAVIVLAGVLAAVAVPRLLGERGFDSRAFYDQSQAVVRYAQKVAIAQRRLVYVDITANRIGVCYDAACTSKVPPPLRYMQKDKPSGAANPGAVNCANDDNWLCAGAPEGVTLAPAANFSFNGLGQPSLAGALTVTIAGDAVHTFTIERETGYVHP